MSNISLIEKENRLGFDYSMLPEHMRDGMHLYLYHGIKPGSFLTSVLENNLVDSFARADIINRQHMFTYATFLYNQAPRGCWGSESQVNEWIKIGGINGEKNGNNN